MWVRLVAVAIVLTKLKHWHGVQAQNASRAAPVIEFDVSIVPVQGDIARRLLVTPSPPVWKPDALARLPAACAMSRESATLRQGR
jgi:hypothetical protein